MAETGVGETWKFSRMRHRNLPQPAAAAPHGWTLRAGLGRLHRCFSRKIAVPMRLHRLWIVFLLLSLAAMPRLHAQVVGSPYSVTVPVTDTSDTQRDQAFSTALAQVMARVAGGQDLRGNPGYAEALGSASSLVQKFQYQRAATGLVLDVDFAPASVRRLIGKLGVASAGIKPPVLLLVQQADGSVADAAELANLATAAAARGTAVIYPAANGDLDPALVAAADPATLARINRQYHTGLVLLGSLHAGSADWTLISGGQAQRWSTQGTDEGAVLADAGNGLVDRLGKQLNVIGSQASEGTLWISGVDSADDYASLLATLGNDPSVRQVTTIGAVNDGVMLDVSASVPISALATSLAAGGRLLVQGEPHPGADANLRWLR